MKKRTPIEAQPLKEPLRFKFWVPGTPKPKARSRSAVSKTGKAFMRDDPRNGPREVYIRECFMAAVEGSGLEPYLPLPAKGGYVTATIWALFPPPAHWFPGMRYTKKPDFDNVGKLPWDALSGKASGRPPLLLQDDQVVDDCRVVKGFWDPRPGRPAGYPEEPGTLIDLTLYPNPRDPELAPAGTWVCPQCGDDEFRDEKHLLRHVKRCAG